MFIDQIEKELKERLKGTKIKINFLRRSCFTIDVNYTSPRGTKHRSFKELYIDWNDPAGFFQGEIQLEEAQ